MQAKYYTKCLFVQWFLSYLKIVEFLLLNKLSPLHPIRKTSLTILSFSLTQEV